jgi:hypothetical protein
MSFAGVPTLLASDRAAASDSVFAGSFDVFTRHVVSFLWELFACSGECFFLGVAPAYFSTSSLFIHN